MTDLRQDRALPRPLQEYTGVHIFFWHPLFIDESLTFNLQRNCFRSDGCLWPPRPRQISSWWQGQGVHAGGPGAAGAVTGGRGPSLEGSEQERQWREVRAKWWCLCLATWRVGPAGERFCLSGGQPLLFLMLLLASRSCCGPGWTVTTSPAVALGCRALSSVIIKDCGKALRKQTLMAAVCV